MLLQSEHLDKHYGGVCALDNVSLSLGQAEILGLVGDNGAGKSTLMKCITGAESPDGGTVIFNGTVLASGSPHASRQAGIEMIYQTLELCAQQDVVSNVFLGRESSLHLAGVRLPFLDSGFMRKTATSLIAQLNENIDVKRKAGTLSGGQRQAVAIARALLFQPRLLIMDEPTAALGLRESTKVLDLVRILKQKGISVILISHRLRDIFETADRVALMKHGKIAGNWAIDKISLPELAERIMAI